MGMGPAPATRKALERAGLKLDEIDLIEVNEAFAGAVPGGREGTRPRREKVNVNGGAIALGHPLGASGTRLLLTLLSSSGAAERSTGWLRRASAAVRASRSICGGGRKGKWRLRRWACWVAG